MADTYTIIPKHGTEAEWNNVRTYVPKLGEIISYTKDETHTKDRLKIGDGINIPKNLPFVGEAGSAISKLDHSISFGPNGDYMFDGSADVVVPVYNGSYEIVNNGGGAGYQEDNFNDD